METELPKCPATGKKSFCTIEAAEYFQQKNREKYNIPRQFPYQCPECESVHLSSTPETETNSNNYARVHLPVLTGDDELSPTKKRIDERRNRVYLAVQNTNKSYETLAKELNITPTTFNADISVLRKKRLIAGRINSTTPAPTTTITSAAQRLAAARVEVVRLEAETKAEDEARIERERVNLDWVRATDNQSIQVSKNGARAVFGVEAWREILPVVQAELARYDAEEIVFPDLNSLVTGTIISGPRAGQIHSDFAKR